MCIGFNIFTLPFFGTHLFQTYFSAICPVILKKHSNLNWLNFRSTVSTSIISFHFVSAQSFYFKTEKVKNFLSRVSGSIVCDFLILLWCSSTIPPWVRKSFLNSNNSRIHHLIHLVTK